MIDDIVARLRARNKRVCYSSSATYSYVDWNIVDPLCGAAADEIERLRAALFQIAHQKYGSQMSCVDNYNALQTAALAALEGEKANG